MIGLFEIAEKILIKNPLVTAFAVVGLVTFVSYALSTIAVMGHNAPCFKGDQDRYSKGSDHLRRPSGNDKRNFCGNGCHRSCTGTICGDDVHLLYRTGMSCLPVCALFCCSSYRLNKLYYFLFFMGGL